MFRLLPGRLSQVPILTRCRVQRAAVRLNHHHESDEAFDARWENYFKKEDLDGWELRRGMNILYGHDLVPEPKIIIAALHACRRLDDFAVGVRFLEMVKQKAVGDKEIISYIDDQLKPTINELGLNYPHELNLD